MPAKASQRIRYRQLEVIAANTSQKLKQIANAYRVGVLSRQSALDEAEKALLINFKRILQFTQKVPVQRDLGKTAKKPSPQQIAQLKSQVKVKIDEFNGILEDIRRS